MNPTMKYSPLLLLMLAQPVLGDYMDQLESSDRLHEQSLLIILNEREALKSDLASENIQLASKALMKTIVAWELSDGVNGIETGDVLVEAWIHNPLLIASWFDSNPASRERWLNSQDYLFNGLVETGSYKEIVELRKKIISSLKNVESDISTSCEQYLEVLLELEVPNYEES